MKAFILAAGLGTRMGELTAKTPKPLLKVAGQTLLELAITRLAQAGVTTIVINTHHYAEQITEYLREQDNFGLEIITTYEQELLGTGGGLLNAREFLADQEHFFVYNTDVYCEFNLTRLKEGTTSSDLATLAVLERVSDRTLLFDTQYSLVGWRGNRSEVAGGIAAGVEQKIEQDLIRPTDNLRSLQFTGVQLVSSRFFRYLEDEQGAFSTIRGYMKAARAGERIIGMPFHEYWLDVGTPQALADLEARLRKQSQMATVEEGLG